LPEPLSFAIFRPVDIREISETDWAQVWPIVRNVVEAAETFVYDPSMSSSQAWQTWVEAPPGLTVVAIQEHRVVGTAKMGPNHQGPGSHVSTASFMVAADARGRGVGTAMCRYALAWAKERGYAGMQFNAVAESNHRAVELYQRHGFTVIGTVPGAFAHPTLGNVGLHVMYCPFLASIHRPIPLGRRAPIIALILTAVVSMLRSGSCARTVTPGRTEGGAQDDASHARLRGHLTDLRRRSYLPRRVTA
jgi:ribosomal protein S18 acetylase RimI-like enzyme